MIPDHIFGEDSDSLLAYQTPKVAHIRDRYVGAAYYCLVSLALCWVVLGQIFWRNEHFMLKDVQGIPRMWIAQPTRNLCDPNDADCKSTFKPMSELPYCKQHAGKPVGNYTADCIYADKHTMFPDGTVGQQMFIPTIVIIVDEEKDCKPSADNKYSCSNEYKKKEGLYNSDYYFNVSNMLFYADIENYRIQFTSTYQRDDITGTSLEHPGFFYECMDKEEDHGKVKDWNERLATKDCKKFKRQAITCAPGTTCNKRGLKSIEDVEGELKKSQQELSKKFEQSELDTGDMAGLQMIGTGASGRALRATRHRRHAHTDTSIRASGEHMDAFATAYGDTFKVGKLLELAGVDLDRHLTVDGEPTRMSGTIIEVAVVYSNLRKFLSSLGMSQVQYTYRVKERKLPYISKEALAPVQPDDFPQRRRYLVQHGIMVNFVVAGEFGFFNVVYLLIMLTTALALLGTAHKITDLTAMYVHPRKRNYFHLKYEVSPDFSDMWKCSACGFFNKNDDYSCKGLDKYESAHDEDTSLCGCKEPTEDTKMFHPEFIAKKKSVQY